MQKKISLDPAFLSLSSSTRKKATKQKSKIKTRPNSGYNANTMRRKLIDKIKNYQNKHGELKEEQPPVKEESFDDEFSSSLDFLHDLSSKHKSKKKNKNKNNKMSRGNPTQYNGVVSNNIILDTTQPPAVSPPPQGAALTVAPLTVAPLTVAPLTVAPPQGAALTVAPLTVAPLTVAPLTVAPLTSRYTVKQPSYSCLKNGSRPTYRELHNQTMRNSGTLQQQGIKIQIPDDCLLNNKTSDVIARNKILRDTKQQYKLDIGGQSLVNHTQCVNKKPKRQKKVRTVKYKLGKIDHKVGVLIKNHSTRKLVQRELAILKQKKLSEIKSYLREKNLLKAGSDAPPDVLRQLYEQSILSGEVKNISAENEIHNFLH